MSVYSIVIDLPMTKESDLSFTGKMQRGSISMGLLRILDARAGGAGGGGHQRVSWWEKLGAGIFLAGFIMFMSGIMLVKWLTDPHERREMGFTGLIMSLLGVAALFGLASLVGLI